MIMDKFVVKTQSVSSKAKTQSHLAVNITANDRTRKYSRGRWHVVLLIVQHGDRSCSKVCGGQAPGSTKNSFEP